MKILQREKAKVVCDVYKNRGDEIAALVIEEIKQRGQGINYPVVRDIVAEITAERLKYYDEAQQ